MITFNRTKIWGNPVKNTIEEQHKGDKNNEIPLKKTKLKLSIKGKEQKLSTLRRERSMNIYYLSICNYHRLSPCPFNLFVIIFNKISFLYIAKFIFLHFERSKALSFNSKCIRFWNTRVNVYATPPNFKILRYMDVALIEFFGCWTETTYRQNTDTGAIKYFSTLSFPRTLVCGYSWANLLFLKGHKKSTKNSPQVMW